RNSLSSPRILAASRVSSVHQSLTEDSEPPDLKMAEARDRLEKPVDYAAIFANRRSRGVLLDDEPASRLGVFEHPVRRLPSGSRVPGSLVGGNYSSWRPGHGNGSGSGQSQFRSSQGRENVPMASARRERGGASRSLLPSWYPRTPLRDITHIMRAIERKRRAGMGVDSGLGAETPSRQQVRVLETPLALAADEPNCVMVTPAPAVGLKRSCPPSTAKVHKMLLDITKEISEEEEEAGFITPEKKLLNSIDVVEKIVMAEIQKLKSTPLAKRQEREKRVKTLMSMR
uniref:Protein GIGAS CELL1 n=4 Tax=Brassica TaxID=3705 RepID=A0A0D3DU24_BRAOL